MILGIYPNRRQVRPITSGRQESSKTLKMNPENTESQGWERGEKEVRKRRW